MTLPAFDKAYSFDVNHLYTSTGTLLDDARAAMLGLKNSLKGFGAAAWTVLGSSNSVVAAMDASDRWTTASNLVWAQSGAHSWIVLQPAGIPGLSICIDLVMSSGSSYHMCSVIASFGAGFTGGSTTARPTATDEIALMTTNSWIDVTPANIRMHVVQATDGSVTNIVICQTNNVRSWWHFSTPKNPISGWTNPAIAIVQQSTPMQVNVLAGNANVRGRIGVSCNFFFTGEAFSTSLIVAQQNYADEDTGEWPMAPIGLFCSTSGHRGRKGTLYDLWWGTTIATIADSYPGSAPLYQFAQFGHLILPWNQTAPLAA